MNLYRKTICALIQPSYFILTLLLVFSFITILTICEMLEIHTANIQITPHFSQKILTDKLTIKNCVLHQKFNLIKLTTITSGRYFAQSVSPEALVKVTSLLKKS